MTAKFNIVASGPVVTISPNSHTVAVDDQVQWSIDAGTGTVVFVSRGIVDFLNETATPESVAAGIAMIAGQYTFAVTVWLKNQGPRTIYGTLIIT